MWISIWFFPHRFVKCVTVWLFSLHYHTFPWLDLRYHTLHCLALPCFIIPCLVLTYHTLPCLSLLYHRDRTHHPLPFLYVHKICETAALLSLQHYLYLILSTFSSTFLCCLRTVLLRLPVLYLFSSNYHLLLPVCDSWHLYICSLTSTLLFSSPPTYIPFLANPLSLPLPHLSLYSSLSIPPFLSCPPSPSSPLPHLSISIPFTPLNLLHVSFLPSPLLSSHSCFSL